MGKQGRQVQNMPKGNPNPLRRQKGNGKSVRLSAYLTPDIEAMLEAHLAGLTPYQASRAVGRLLRSGLETERQFGLGAQE